MTGSKDEPHDIEERRKQDALAMAYLLYDIYQDHELKEKRVPTTNENDLAGFKEALKKSGIEYATDEEYQKARDNLVGYFDTLIQMDQAQQANNILSSDKEGAL